jgi:hypothetical protein
MSANRSFLRAWKRWVGAVSIVCIVSAGLAFVPDAAAVPAVVPPTSARTVADATRLAAQYNTSVEVAEKTNEYVRTVATPEGTLQAELSNAPVRVRRGSDWVSIDRTLAARADGMVAPRASAVDVSFSGGGTDVLARFQQDDQVMELKSPWKLPTRTCRFARGCLVVRRTSTRRAARCCQSVRP